MQLKNKYRTLQMQNNQTLSEGLRANDLKEMVHSIFEVDTYCSKMGEDRDVCVLSFTVKDRGPASDLMEFIEKGYKFVLDSDISTGENENGEYNVFVEISRTPKLAEQIKELTYGVEKLTGISNWSFKYHKNSDLHEAEELVISSIIPLTPQNYDGLLVKVKTEGVKKFFSKTLMDDLTLDGDVITIHKPFGQRISLRLVNEGDSKTILENNTDTYQTTADAMSEIFWLTKVLGDYNIHKLGENFVFTNNNKAILIQRL